MCTNVREEGAYLSSDVPKCEALTGIATLILLAGVFVVFEVSSTLSYMAGAFVVTWPALASRLVHCPTDLCTPLGIRCYI